uniref:Nucleotidyltransferase domain-containing protein n=1 Tax=Candidatus Kentrum sp. MB TaxID=2138164 RepID=A0A450X0Q1_9GAMM|nr:MAG: Nucleotidyltransferase domain-containing protein [Candidatus Kentron sp. MB]
MQQSEAPHANQRVKPWDEIVHRLMEGLAPEKVILFGSHAWGKPTPDSDVDLLVIISHSALARYRFRPTGHK